MTTTGSGSPAINTTAAAKTAPQESQGIMTRSKTSTIGSASLLSPPLPPAPNPDGDIFEVEAHGALPLPPPTTLPVGGIREDLSDLSEPYVPIVSTRKHRTTPMAATVAPPPVTLPVALVNIYPPDFNRDDDSLSDDDAKDNLGEIAPADRGGVPAAPISDEDFCKGLTTMKARCDEMFHTLAASNKVTVLHHNTLLAHKASLDQAKADHESLQAALALLTASFTKVSDASALVSSNITQLVHTVTSLDDRLTSVASTLTGVVSSTAMASAKVTDMNTMLHTHLSTLESSMSVLS